MLDLWIAVIVMGVICAAAAGAAYGFLYSEKHPRMVIAFMALAILGAVLFLLRLQGHLMWARFVPHSAAIIYTNVAALFAALAAGWGARLPDTPRWRRMGVSGLLGLASLAAIMWPMLSMAVRPPPEGQDEWKGPVALQTSWATCSPAAAATLLSAEEIPASEREMIPLCLTDYAGTPTLGMYRGIKLMANKNNREVEIVDSGLDQLLSDNDWPVLMAVRLPFGVEDPRFTQEWGWIPGMGHSVVALGFAIDGRLIVADPAFGLEHWTMDQLNVLWQGNGIRIK
ncbi:MAG: peptidase C39 [Pirellulaceae bacterium]